MPFDFGAIVLVPFPFTNQAAAKRRPAVVVSPRAYNDVRPDAIVMPVTSQLRPSAQFGETWVQAWKTAGLLKPSAVKPVIATLEQRMVMRRLGTLDATDAEALRHALRRILG